MVFLYWFGKERIYLVVLIVVGWNDLLFCKHEYIYIYIYIRRKLSFCVTPKIFLCQKKSLNILCILCLCLYTEHKVVLELLYILQRSKQAINWTLCLYYFVCLLNCFMLALLHRRKRNKCCFIWNILVIKS